MKQKKTIDLNAGCVSYDDEMLILVNQQDDIVGYKEKLDAHLGRGLLHRAFSVFLFDQDNRLLLQQRSEQKLLWPLYWTNTCCSHPRKGETYEYAANRRTMEELGVSAPLFKLYQFIYSAEFNDIGSENELCSVFVGRLPEEAVVKANENEVADWKWVSLEELDRQVVVNPEAFTPWFLLEWEQLRIERRNAFSHLLERADQELGGGTPRSDYHEQIGAGISA